MLLNNNLFNFIFWIYDIDNLNFKNNILKMFNLICNKLIMWLICCKGLRYIEVFKFWLFFYCISFCLYILKEILVEENLWVLDWIVNILDFKRLYCDCDIFLFYYWVIFFYF